jgi:HEAT repeat protein
MKNQRVLPVVLLTALMGGAGLARETQVDPKSGPAPCVETRTLCGFEDAGDIARFFGASTWADVQFTTNYAVEGRACARVAAGPDGGGFRAAFSGKKAIDLSGWDVIRLRLFNPNDKRVRIDFGIFSDNGAVSRFPQTFIGPKSGRWVEVPIATLQWDRLDVSKISKIHILFSPRHSAGQDAEDAVAFEAANALYVDALQLRRTTYDRKALAGHVGRNPALYLDALTNSPMDLARETMDRLVYADTEDAARILFRALEDPRLAYPCTDALLTMSESAVLVPAAESLKSDNRNRRMLACTVLARFGQPQHAALISALLADPDQYVRHFAASALADCAWTNCEEVLVKALDDGYPMVRLNAARALRQARRNLDRVRPALERHIDDRAAGVNAIRALVDIGAKESTPALCRALGDPGLAWEAARALQALRCENAGSGITAVLNEAIRTYGMSGASVAAACMAAGELRCAEAQRALNILSVKSPDEQVRYFSTRALGRLGGTGTAMNEVLDDVCPLVRMAAVRALASNQLLDEGKMAGLAARRDASIDFVLNDLQYTNTPGVAADRFRSGKSDVPLAMAANEPFVLFGRRFDRPLRRGDAPCRGDATGRIVVAVAEGERAWVQIGIHASTNLSGVTVNLSAAGRELLGAPWLLVEEGGQTSLRPANATGPLAAGQTAAFWFQLTAPRVPDHREAMVSIGSGAQVRRIKVVLDVLPFSLPELSEPMHILYTGELNEGLLTNSPESVARAIQYNADFAAHGMNTACPTPEFTYAEGTNGLPDTRLLDAGLDLSAQCGLTHPLGFFFIGNPLSINKRKWGNPCTGFRPYLHLKRLERLVYQMLAHKGRRPAVYLIDEPGLHDTGQDGPARNHMATQLYTRAHEIPGAFTAMTGSGDDFDAAGQDIDLWVFGGPARMAQSERAMNLGVRVTNYGGMDNRAGSGMAYRNKFGAYSWRSGDWGQGLWTYPYKMCAKITPEGIEPYTDWECMQAGVDDLRYLRLLENRARTDPGIRQKARILFRALNASLHPERDHASWSDVDPRQIRAAVVDILLSGQSASSAAAGRVP